MAPTEVLRFTSVTIENFEKITLAEMAFGVDDHLVRIGGENGQGKSAALNAIQSLLTGVPSGMTQPIKQGAEKGVVTGTLPPYIVERTFHEDRTVLKVKRTDDGSTLEAPGTFMKRLIGERFVNPVDFLESAPVEQREKLMELLELGEPFYKIDEQIEEARKIRKKCLEDQERLEAKLADLVVPEDTPDKAIDVTEISEKVAQSGRNSGLKVLYQSKTIGLQNTADDLRKEIKSLQDRLGTTSEELDAHNLMPCPEPEDVSDLQDELNAALVTNDNVKVKLARAKAADEWDVLDVQAQTSRTEISVLEGSKKSLLAKSDMPVPGLGFAESSLTLNGLPFKQASQAEQVSAAVAISLHLKGELAIIFMYNASIMDRHMLKVVAEKAREHGALVLAEIVTNDEAGSWDKDCDFYFVDGAVQTAERQEQ